MQASDIFLLASVGEAFGNVLTEAMACGAPVVASRSGGIEEIVVDGETGLLVPPRSSAAFADAIEKLATDPQLRNEMGRRARERVLEAFTLDQFVEKTIRVYETICALNAEPVLGVGNSVR